MASRGVQRAFSTVSRRAAAEPAMLSVAPVVSPYPFSKTAKAVEVSPEPLPAKLLKGTNLMTHLRETLPTGYTKQLLEGYFNPKSSQQIFPGSVVSVTYDGGSFAGVLVSVRHKGVDTSFTLRNVVQRTGVEMRFTVGSPMIKEVKVISRAGGTGPRDVKMPRRAKLFYLRDQPAKMTAISSAVKRSG